jgi:hypothetical protein
MLTLMYLYVTVACVRFRQIFLGERLRYVPQSHVGVELRARRSAASTTPRWDWRAREAFLTQREALRRPPTS